MVQILISKARSILHGCPFGICLLTFFLVSSSAQAQSKPHYVIGARCLDAIICKSPISEGIVTEIYKRIGATIEFLYFPRLREIKEAQEGRLDGISARTKKAMAGKDNLVAVPVPFGKASIVAFTAEDSKKISTLNELTGQPIAVLRGDSFSTSLIKPITNNIIHVDDIVAGLKLVQKGYVRAIFYDYYIGSYHIKLTGMKGISASPILATAEVYHAVHKRNAHLVPRLSAAIRSMHQDGTMKKLFGKFNNNIPNYPAKK